MEKSYKDDLIMEDPLWNLEQVSDWNLRIADYPAEAKEFYQRMLAKTEQLKALSESDGWSNQVTDKKADVRIDSKRSKSTGLLTMFA